MRPLLSRVRTIATIAAIGCAPDLDIFPPGPNASIALALQGTVMSARDSSILSGAVVTFGTTCGFIGCTPQPLKTVFADQQARYVLLDTVDYNTESCGIFWITAARSGYLHQTSDEQPKVQCTMQTQTIDIYLKPNP